MCSYNRSNIEGTDLTDGLYICEESLEICICLCPEVTLCGCQDIKIQLPLLALSFFYPFFLFLFLNLLMVHSPDFYFHKNLDFFLLLDRVFCPEGRPGMSEVFLLSGISGLSFDSPFLSPLLFFSVWSSCSFCLVIFLLMVHSPDFSRKLANIFP